MNQKNTKKTNRQKYLTQLSMLAFALLLVVIVSACAPTADSTMTAQNAENIVTDYKRYNQVEFDTAVSQGKTVILNFYADWCPTCAQERPAVQEVFSEQTEIVAFEVHYRSSSTTPEETALAREYGITAQGTKVILRPNSEVEKIIGHWTKEEWNEFISTNS